MSVSLIVAGVAAVAAIVSAVATAVMVRLSSRLARSTENYARLVQEQLDLLRAQLAAPLLLDVNFLQGPVPQLTARCRHSGNSSSLPAILTAVTLRLLLPEGSEESQETEEHRLNDDILKPGKTWSRSFGDTTALKIGRLPAPAFWRAVFHGGPRQQTAARLSVTLRFRRGGQTGIEEVTREYEVRTRHFGGPALEPL